MYAVPENPMPPPLKIELDINLFYHREPVAATCAIKRF
jgi:hypothetical protein